MAVLKKMLFFIIAVFFLVPPVSYASYIDSQKISIDLQNSGSAHVVSDVVYKELTSIEIPYTVFGNVEGFSARDEGGSLNCSITPQSYGDIYSCKPNSRQVNINNYTVFFEFDAKNLVIQTASAHIFSYVNGVSTPTRSLEILLTLPEGTGLVRDSNPYPEATIGSTGRRTTLDWSLNSPELGKTYTFTATYEQVGQIVRYYGNYSRYIAVFFALAFAFVLWRYWAYRRTNTSAVLAILKDDEKKVFGIILQAKGKCKQNNIVQGTNFSKAKVSRILSDLESRGLIEKIRTGRTNRIVVSRGRKPELKAEESIRAPLNPNPSSSARLSEAQ